MSTADKTDFSSRDRWLTATFLAGPLAAMSNLIISDALEPTSCAAESKAILHLTSGGFLLLTLITALASWRLLLAGAKGTRFRWMAISALALAMGSAIVILAIEVPNLLLRSCE